MSTEHKPHSALDRAKEFLGEIEQRPLDYTEGLVFDLVEQLEALVGPLEQISRLHRSDADQAPHIARRTLVRHYGSVPAREPS